MDIYMYNVNAHIITIKMLVKSKEIRNSIWLYILQLFNSVVPLITLPYITRILGKLLSFKHYAWWYRRYDHFIQFHKNSDLCTIPTGRKHYLGEVQKKSVFYPCKKYDFEGHKLWGPADADKYLRTLYGDYMKLPPNKKRETHFYTKIKI